MSTLLELKSEIKKRLERSTGRRFAVLDFDNTCIVNDIAEAALAFMCKNKRLKNNVLPIIKENSTPHYDYHEKVFKHYHDLHDSGDVKSAYAFCAETFGGHSLDEAETVIAETLAAEGEELGKAELLGIVIARGIVVRPTIRELISFLEECAVDIWIVSASPEIAVSAAMKHLHIKGNVIGLKNKVIGDILHHELHEPLSMYDGKVECIKTYIDSEQRPIFAIGDSMNDLPMIEYADIHAIVDRDNELSRVAEERKWFVLKSD